VFLKFRRRRGYCELPKNPGKTWSCAKVHGWCRVEGIWLKPQACAGPTSDIEVADCSTANNVSKWYAPIARLPIAENTFCFELTPLLRMKKRLDRFARGPRLPANRGAVVSGGC
jgi:hypothetical protein